MKTEGENCFRNIWRSPKKEILGELPRSKLRGSSPNTDRSNMHSEQIPLPHGSISPTGYGDDQRNYAFANVQSDCIFAKAML
jgi:hypothetical protein